MFNIVTSEIDKIGISKRHFPMNRCVENLHIPIDKLYIDGTSYEYRRIYSL